MSHIAIQFPVEHEEQAALIMALLDGFPTTGFEEEATVLTAYCKEIDFDESLLTGFLGASGFVYSINKLEDKNWNELWESNFDPVLIGKPDATQPDIIVRASFHQPMDAVYDLLITPKMSFGTGHHATTFQMMEQMLSLSLTGQKLIDFGTGTGLLAILAEKMGAERVLAIDNDDWSIENAGENISANHCNKIDLVKADVCLQADYKADVMLANINLNVILDNLEAIKNATASGGLILFSGILEHDLEKLTAAPLFSNIEVMAVSQKNGWLVIKALNN